MRDHRLRGGYTRSHAWDAVGIGCAGPPFARWLHHAPYTIFLEGCCAGPPFARWLHHEQVNVDTGICCAGPPFARWLHHEQPLRHNLGRLCGTTVCEVVTPQTAKDDERTRLCGTTVCEVVTPKVGPFGPTLRCAGLQFANSRVEQETVRAVVLAYAGDKIELEKPTSPKARNTRYAPSFLLGFAFKPNVLFPRPLADHLQPCLHPFARSARSEGPTAQVPDTNHNDHP